MREKGYLQILIYILLSMFFCGLCSMTVKAEGDIIFPQIYEMPDETGYYAIPDYKTDRFSYGKTNMGQFSVNGNFVATGTYSNYSAYAVDDVVTFSYRYGGIYNSDDETVWDIISDDTNNLAGLNLDKKIKEGVVIIQKSTDGITWTNATEPVNDFLKNSNDENPVIYTANLNEIKQGTYYKITVAYSMQKGSEIREFVEKYEFFLCTDKLYVNVKDLSTKKNVGANTTVQSGFYIEKNGSGDMVTVSKDGGEEVEVLDYATFTEPGAYYVRKITRLGKVYSNRIEITEGLDGIQLRPIVRECKEEKGFDEGTDVYGITSSGIYHYTSLQILQPSGFSMKESKYNGYKAYGLNANSVSIYLTLNYPKELTNNGWSVVSSSYGKKAKETICGVQTGEMGTGALIIQTSSTGEEGDWTNIDMGRYATGLYTTDYGTYYDAGEMVCIYIPEGENGLGPDILNGMYVRVLYAYQIQSKEEKEIIDCLEKYEFYMCSNELGAVTIHNHSAEEIKDELLGDENENVIEMYNRAEDLPSGSATVKGFTIDLSLNPTVQYVIKKDGSRISPRNDHIYNEPGRYDIEFKSILGDTETRTIYLDTASNEEILKRYFGENFVLGKRIFAEGEYPVYEGGDFTTYNLVEVSENYLPISGQICNLDTGELIELEESREARSGVLKSPGRYEAVFNVGGNVGDVRTIHIHFTIIAEGTAPGPQYNQDKLKEYAITNVTDMYPVYYGITYPSSATGFITVVFANREEALLYAYENAKGMVEKQSDGTYRFNGKIDLQQKQKYDSAWELTEDEYAWAEENVKKYYFDLSDEFTYQTLSKEVIETYPNLRQLELQNSVIVFADGQREKLATQSERIVLNEKQYRELIFVKGDEDEVSVNKETETQMYSSCNDFEFTRDKNGVDSNTVVITDAEGNIYDIAYGVGVGKQLREAGCATGIVTITETTIYGDSTSYEAVFIEEGVNTAEVTLCYYENGNEQTCVLSAKEENVQIEADVFTIETVSDLLDPYSLVIISKDGIVIDFYAADQLFKNAWTEAGNYTVKVVNRLGYSFSFDILVKENNYAVITFVGEGTDDVKAIITQKGTRGISLPKIDRSGYIFVGYQDELGNVYEKTIDVENNVYKLTAMWNPEKVKIVMKDNAGNVLSESMAEYGAEVQLSIPIQLEGQEFVEWKVNGKPLSDNILKVDKERIVVVCVTKEIEKSYSEIAPLRNTAQNSILNYMHLIIMFLSIILGIIFLLVLGKMKKSNDKREDN